jgi:signal recognition particle GTPase
MKWGVRRFQNEDGSLTDAGRKRYSNILDRGTRRAQKEYAKYQKSSEKANRLIDKSIRRSQGLFRNEKAANKAMNKATRKLTAANRHLRRANRILKRLDKKLSKQTTISVPSETKELGRRIADQMSAMHTATYAARMATANARRH